MIRSLRLSLCAVTLAVASGCGSSVSEPAGAELIQPSSYASIPGYEISESPGACPVLSSEDVDLMDRCIAPPAAHAHVRRYAEGRLAVWPISDFRCSCRRASKAVGLDRPLSSRADTDRHGLPGNSHSAQIERGREGLRCYRDQSGLSVTCSTALQDQVLHVRESTALLVSCRCSCVPCH